MRILFLVLAISTLTSWTAQAGEFSWGFRTRAYGVFPLFRNIIVTTNDQNEIVSLAFNSEQKRAVSMARDGHFENICISGSNKVDCAQTQNPQIRLDLSALTPTGTPAGSTIAIRAITGAHGDLILTRTTSGYNLVFRGQVKPVGSIIEFQ